MSRDRQQSGGADASAGYCATRQHGGQPQAPHRSNSYPTGEERQTTTGTVQRHGSTIVGGERAKRPTGLGLVAVTIAVLGGLLVLAALTLFDGASEVPGDIGGTFKLIGLLTGGFGVGHLAAAYGLWTVTSWGRTLALWLVAGSLLLCLLVVLNGGSAAVPGLVLYGGMSWYLRTNAELYRRLRQP